MQVNQFQPKTGVAPLTPSIGRLLINESVGCLPSSGKAWRCSFRFSECLVLAGSDGRCFPSYLGWSPQSHSGEWSSEFGASAWSQVVPGRHICPPAHPITQPNLPIINHATNQPTPSQVQIQWLKSISSFWKRVYPWPTLWLQLAPKTN